jgi:hypothetical protein
MEKDSVVEEAGVLRVVLEVEEDLVVQKVQEHSVDHRVIIVQIVMEGNENKRYKISLSFIFFSRSGSSFRGNAMSFGAGALGGMAAYSLMRSMGPSYHSRPGYYEPGYGGKICMHIFMN